MSGGYPPQQGHVPAGGTAPPPYGTSPHTAYGSPTTGYGTPTSMVGTQTAPPTKKSNGPLIGGLIVGAVLIVVAAIFTGYAVTRGGDTGSPTTAVEGYFTALADGDAARALGYAVSPPPDDSLLTDEMLEASGPIRNVEVSEVDDGVTMVPVSYSIGDHPVTTSVQVRQVDGEWKLAAVAIAVDVSGAAVQPTVNGAATSQDTVYLFPGHYQVSTGNAYVDFDEDARSFYLEELSTTPHLARGLGKVHLLQAGHDAMIEAAEASLQECMDRKELTPEGCPFKLTPDLEGGKYILHEETIEFFMSPDQFGSAKPQLSSDNPFVATFTYVPEGRWTAKATNTETDNEANADLEVHPSDTNIARMDFSGEEPEFSWVSE